MATATTSKRTTQRSRNMNGHNGSGAQRAGSSRAGQRRPGAGDGRAGAVGSSGRKARPRPASEDGAGRAGPVRQALKAASKTDGSGAGKLETLTAVWRVGRLAWRVARGKRPKAKQVGKAASSATEVGAKALAAKAPKAVAANASRALAAKAPKAPLRPLAEAVRKVPVKQLPEHVRRAPIQLSIDVAVPLEIAYHEWMKLDSLPEGAHEVVDIERQDEALIGAINGLGEAQEWEAEIRDERPNESFAWRSTRGSDVAGLITFHRLAERLTRLEVELDVVPVRVTEAVSLSFRLADRHAETELRRFKSRVEMINPDAYPASVKSRKQKTSKSTKED